MKQNQSSSKVSAKPGTKKKYSRNAKGNRNRPLPTGEGNKTERRAEEEVDTALKQYKSRSNPWTWYGAYPEYAEQVTNLAFGIPLGQPIDLGNGDTTTNAGIMILHFYPTPGNSVDLNSPLNRQAFKFQTYLRSIQRAAASYDAADTIMYAMAIDSLYMYWSMMRRAYRTANLMSPVNKYLPRRLLQAQGIDPSICENLADFQSYINNFAISIGRFTMPKEFDINLRHMWMCEGVYLDSSSNRSQMYCFVPMGFYQYDNTVTTGSQLVMQPWQSIDDPNPTLHTFSEIVALGNQLLNAVINDQDTANISGDLFRAYPESSIMTLPVLDAAEIIIPVYDETVLSQIENSVAVGAPYASNSATSPTYPKITQDPSVNNGAVLFDWYYTGGLVASGLGGYYVYNYPLMYPNAVLNSHSSNPTSGEIMEMTRLTPVTEQTVELNNTGIRLGLQSHGSDIIAQYMIGVTSFTNPAAIRWLQSRTNTIYYRTDTSALLSGSNGLEWIALSEQFDWAPLIYIASVTPVAGAAPSVDFRFFAADVDNMTVASATQMFNIHEAAMLSLLDIPQPPSNVSK